jgi:hypothetical protein
MTDQPKTPGQMVYEEYCRQRDRYDIKWDAIAQAAIQASGLVEAAVELADLMALTPARREMVSQWKSKLAKLKGQSNG